MIILKDVRAAKDGTVARPSRPSVKLTAFEVEMITKHQKMIQ